jgi:ABC-2 type transport system permease protein
VNRIFRGPLAELVVARWRMFFREPGAVFWTFGFPILLSIALGIAFRERPPEPVAAAIVEGPGAEPVLDALAGSPGIKAKILDEPKAQGALRSGRVSIVIVPAREGAEPLTYRFDPTRPESRIARLAIDDALQRAAGRVDPTRVAEAKVTEPGSRYIDFLIPGLVGMGLMQSGLWGIGYVIVEMRTRKLIKRMLATPMKKLDFLLSFVLMRAVFLLGELPVLLGFGALAFGVPLRGSIVLLASIAVLGSLVFAGIGLLVASRAQNTQTVSGLINLVSMPMFLASGTFFSSSRFPDAVQPVVRALPLTALNDALRAVMLDGAGPRAVAAQVAVLAAWGVVSFAAALRLFRWR